MICPHGGLQATLDCPNCGPQARLTGALPDLSWITEQVEAEEFTLSDDGRYVPLEVR